MRDTFTDYHEAKAYALSWAKQMGGRTDVGIEKKKEYGRTIYLVLLLPKPEKSRGYELRCERVTIHS